MPSNAIAAYGTLLKRGSSPSGSNPQAYATIGEVKNISGPSREMSTIDVTTHSSAASGFYREFIPSLIDSGELEVELNYVPTDTTLQGLQADFTSRTKRDFRITTPGGSGSGSGASQNIDFAAYVTAFPHEFPTDDVMGANITLKITGGVTFGTPAA